MLSSHTARTETGSTPGIILGLFSVLTFYLLTFLKKYKNMKIKKISNLTRIIFSSFLVLVLKVSPSIIGGALYG